MEGVFALAGGDEFRRAYDKPDSLLLERLPQGHGPIVIIPTAAGRQGPEMAIANGVRHFQGLVPRAAVEGAPVVDNATANNSALAARIASASLIYLTGGDPGHLVRSLRGSEVLAAIAGVAARGGIVAGSSAGAMALCEVMRWGGGWEPGLDLVPGLVVLPHHNAHPVPLAATRAGMPSHLIALGIPTGVLCLSQPSNPADPDATTWLVLGKQPVTIYYADRIVQVQPNEMFTL